MKSSSIHRVATLFALSILSATMLFAHGDEKHVMGTVSKATDSTITVKDMHGKSVDVAISSATKFMKGDKLVAAKDVKEGDRVVIHAKPNGDKLDATMVMIGAKKMTNMKHDDDMKGMDMHSKSPTSPK